ncbi:hypothetical protein [Croceivirga thetidis]|uniref:DUF4181 domain-containing protein n=1 Tax=Croceivirga thetidis TaxID=2721623 RepID=A0ABX1GTG1_9FLAO|nr:hypothetical protein [Croceivirga thetidis]NKI32290.1 hypothetical protein [Croceivirga thetidis]
MHDLKYQILYWIIVEVLLIIVFYAVSKWLDPKNSGKTIQQKFTSWLKGFLERIFLTFLLLTNFEGSALVLFGAIKLGTRLESDKENKVNNDYFVVGNLISIAAAVIIYLIFNQTIILE